MFPRGSLMVSAQDIASRTGLHRNTVRRRMNALTDGGVVDGYLLEPHPGLLGLVRAGHRFDGVSVANADALAKLIEPFPWVSMAILHLDACFLHTYHETPDGITGDIAQLAAALGARHVLPAFRSDQWPPMPADRLDASDIDRRVLIALRRGSRRSVQQVADEVGASRRTVARRVARLAEAGAGAMMPVFRPSRLEGCTVAIYECSASPGAAAALKQLFPDRIMGPVVAGPRAMVMVPEAGLDEPVRRATEARNHAALADLELQFMRDGLFPEACDAWLAERVQNAPPREAKA